MHALKIVLLIIALVLLIVSVATPVWLEGTLSVVRPPFEPGFGKSINVDPIKSTITAGLWEQCRNLGAGSSTPVDMCQSNISLTGNKDNDATINSVRTLSLLSVVLVAFAILCCFMCKNKAPVMVLICIALLSCITTIGVVAGKMSKTLSPPTLGMKLSVREGYSFWLQVAAACVLLLVFVMKLMVKGKKM